MLKKLCLLLVEISYIGLITVRVALHDMPSGDHPKCMDASAFMIAFTINYIFAVVIPVISACSFSQVVQLLVCCLGQSLDPCDRSVNTLFNSCPALQPVC